MHPDKLATSYHNDQFKQQPSVIMAWSNGEITITKGGELFGQRSLHQICGEIPGTERFGWFKNFPIKNNDISSYAIVETEEQAYEIRGLIIDSVCDWLQSRKKLKY